MQSGKKQWQILRPVAILFIAIFGAAIFFGIGYFQSTKELTTLKQAAAKPPEQDAKTLVHKVSEHLLLPDEKPTIATVEDTKKLSNQPFFKNAKKGDSVLVYTNSKKAILYRLSEDKVIEVAHLK